MLERLEITDFAVARSVTIEPGAGLTVFTGETGAGKSLVVDALAFVFGARRGREVIATGAERATVRAVVGIDGKARVIERTIALSGRTSARIDDQQATVEDLRALAEGFIDIHGQSEQLSILSPRVQLAVLDEFAGLASQRDAVAQTVRELRDVRRQLASLATDARERERLVEQLRFETEEIDAAGLRPGEDDELRREQGVLSNARRLLEDVEVALESLDSAALGEAVRATGDLVARDPGAGEVAELAVSLEATSGELSRALRRYRDGLEEDPERLAVIGERLDRIARLCRKYGDTVEDVIRFGEEASKRLAELTGEGASLEGLQAKEAALLGRLGELATALSRARRSAAGDLVRAIAEELEAMGMGSAVLSVGFACEDDESGPLVAVPDYEIVITRSPLAGEGEPHAVAFTETGIDRVEFLVSFNPGESPRALSAVASGGETSRFLLALTTALGSSGSGRLEVLDEVDEGVGGRTGAVVGAALRRLAAKHQVLCITHLPQVAAYGERHLVVSKQSDGSRTWSEVAEVAGKARVGELADMLGGVGEAGRKAAEELLASAREGEGRREEGEVPR
ncbi:MAG: DNA repair protein RecN [Dehalococcoidia bacterium]